MNKIQLIETWAEEIRERKLELHKLLNQILKDETIPYEKRFELWDKYGDKQRLDSYPCSSELRVTSDVFEEIRCDRFDRYELVTLEKLIRRLVDSEYEHLADDIKQEWFENNIGSFLYDW